MELSRVCFDTLEKSQVFLGSSTIAIAGVALAAHVQCDEYFIVAMSMLGKYSCRGGSLEHKLSCIIALTNYTRTRMLSTSAELKNSATRDPLISVITSMTQDCLSINNDNDDDDLAQENKNINKKLKRSLVEDLYFAVLDTLVLGQEILHESRSSVLDSLIEETWIRLWDFESDMSSSEIRIIARPIRLCNILTSSKIDSEKIMQRLFDVAGNEICQMKIRKAAIDALKTTSTTVKESGMLKMLEEKMIENL
jgi:hypothetical protein